MVASGLIPGSRQRHATALSRRSVMGGQKVSSKLPSTLVFDMADREDEERKEPEVVASSASSLPSSLSRSNPSTSRGSDKRYAQEASVKKATDLVRMKHINVLVYTSCKNRSCARIVQLLVKVWLKVFIFHHDIGFYSSLFE